MKKPSLIFIFLGCSLILTGCASKPESDFEEPSSTVSSIDSLAINSEPCLENKEISILNPNYEVGQDGYMNYINSEYNETIAFSRIQFIPEFTDLNQGVAFYFKDTKTLEFNVEVGGQFGQRVSFSVELDTNSVTWNNEVADSTQSAIDISDSEAVLIANKFYELFVECQGM